MTTFLFHFSLPRIGALILLFSPGPVVGSVESDAVLADFGPLEWIGGKDGQVTDNSSEWLASYEGQPATEVDLSEPHSAMGDLSGNVYIADKNAHAVRVIDGSGLIRTVAGTNTAGYNGDGPATLRQLDGPQNVYPMPDGSFYILDTGNQRIRRVDPAGQMTTVVVESNGLSRGLWLSFLIFGTYLVITFAGVDHRDLLLKTPIMLPVLDAPLPLVTFFWVAPILFVIFHLYLLLSLKLLADQVHHYLGAMAETGLDSEAQDRARLQLPNFVVVQVLGGTSGQINSWAGRLMRLTAFLTLAAGPIILLLFAQLMFLPYHGWGVTMTQRATVMLDLVFIWYFWRAITRPEREGFHVRGGMASAALVVVTFFGLMYPGERFYGPLPMAVFQETGRNWETFGLEVLYNTLVLPGEPLVGNELFDKLEARNKAKGLAPWKGERSISQVLTHRDFRHADFRNIDLRKASLDGSSLVGASLDGASLQGAFLDSASLQGASLE